jgi:hypothetical protein
MFEENKEKRSCSFWQGYYGNLLQRGVFTFQYNGTAIIVSFFFSKIPTPLLNKTVDWNNFFE